jgi:hypothetical protein
VTRRSKVSRITGAVAHCDDCPFRITTRNAVGLAAQHADRHPTHTVHAEQTLQMIFNRK